MTDEYTARNLRTSGRNSLTVHAPPLCRYTADMERDGCYVNPFVGEGGTRATCATGSTSAEAPDIVINFDEWTDDAATTMRAVADFLNLAPFTFRVAEAHNTHKSRSVHVEKEEVDRRRAQGGGGDRRRARLRHLLHPPRVLPPVQRRIDELLAEYAYPPMRWSSGARATWRAPTSTSTKDVRGGAGDQVLETHQSEFFGDIDMKELDKEKKKKHSKKKSS